MMSNVSSALRGILAKQSMGGGVGENMNETNLFETAARNRPFDASRRRRGHDVDSPRSRRG